MNITILADASHCPDTKAAGYAYWIASTRGSFGGAGPLKGKVETSTLAEVMAIANAVHIAIARKSVVNGDTILCQTDCEAAISLFEDRRSKPSVFEYKVKLHIDQLIKDNSIILMFKHIKAHSGQRGARFIANDKCDKSARKEMRRQRGKFICEDGLDLLRRHDETNARRRF